MFKDLPIASYRIPNICNCFALEANFLYNVTVILAGIITLNGSSDAVRIGYTRVRHPSAGSGWRPEQGCCLHAGRAEGRQSESAIRIGCNRVRQFL